MTIKKAIAVLLNLVDLKRDYTDTEINEAIEFAREVLISSYSNRVGL